MCENQSHTTGVYPLMCAVCHRVCGVINVAAFDRMTDAGEDYICSHCLLLPESYLEFAINHTPFIEWYKLSHTEIQRPGYLPVAHFTETLRFGINGAGRQEQ